MVLKQFRALFKARTMEYVRDRGTFYWNLIFPVLLVLGLAFAFSGGDDKLFKVGFVGGPDPSVRLLGMEQVQAVPYPDAESALRRLARHQIDFFVDFTTSGYAVNEESSKGRLVRELFLAQLAASPGGAAGFSETSVVGKAPRYVDWLVPGVIGMNMLFSSLFGVGFVIVRYRKNGVLKRFKATPVAALNFVSAQAASRLVIVLLTSAFVFAGTNAVLRFMMRGSYLNLLLLTVLGILCMISLGLVFASRMRSEEMANGVLNIVTFPMLALSGVFFSLEGSPAILRTVSRAFPLTHFIEGARAIMLDGAGLAAVAPNMAVLAGLTVVFLAIAAALFQWE